MKKEERSMPKDECTTDSVIARGYDIYDEWKNKGCSSRRIARAVRLTAGTMHKKETYEARAEALACLLALDLRIKERYNKIFKRIFRFLAYRRERAILKWLQTQLNIQHNVDVRTAIEIEIKRMRENPGLKKADETDGKAGGGRTNEVSKQESTATGDKADVEKTDEKNVDVKNAAEEKSEEDVKISDAQPEVKAQEVEQKIEVAEEQHVLPDKQEQKSASTVQINTQEQKQQNNQATKTENNGTVHHVAGSTTDNIKENKGYNNAIDSPPLPLYNKTERVKITEERSFIDEVIMDNMIKGKEDIIGHNPLQDVKKDTMENRPISNIQNGERDNKESSQSYLYDKMIRDAKDGNLGNIANNNLQNNNKNPALSQNIKQEGLRISMQPVLSEEMENAFRGEINSKFDNKMILLHKSIMENALREEFKLDVEDFGVDDPAVGNVNNDDLDIHKSEQILIK